MTRTEHSADGARAPELPIVWRVSRTGLVAARVLIAASGTAILALMAWVLIDPKAHRLAAGLVATFAAGLVLVVWRSALHPRLVAEETGIVVRNPTSTRRVPWTDVVEVYPGFDGVTVTSTSGPPAIAWAVQKANLSSWRGARTRADVVAATLVELAEARGATPRSADGELRETPREVEPIDAARRPLRFPWRLTRPEAAVLGFLRHSSSPLISTASGVLFAGFGLVFLGFCVTQEVDGALLRDRGAITEGTVLAVPGLVEVTWPELTRRSIFLEAPVKNAAASYRVGQEVEVVYDPQKPTRARLVGFAPGSWGYAAGALGALALGAAELKWARWLAVARRAAPPTPPGRHHA